MGNGKAQELIRKYFNGTATPEEVALLESWYLAMGQDQPEMPEGLNFPKIGEEILRPLRAEQESKTRSKPASPIRLWPGMAAAAAVLILLSVGSLIIFHKKPAPPLVQSQPQENDILPARARAILTLPDGKTIPLDSATNNTLVQQDHVMMRSANGQLIYSAESSGLQVAATAYHTLTTTPGEHYSLILPDGTTAWLNAESSITYPVSFSQADRKVKVTGEVYFEIVHNDKQPFRIKVSDLILEDLGTHIDINAYDDEQSIKTTLLEGSLKISKANRSAILVPGQQAKTRRDNDSFHIINVDADKAIGWKNGYFYFEEADIRTVMRAIARWYDVQVVYKGELPTGKFKGKVDRNIKASEALGILSYFGAHFHIRGRTITVSA